MSDLDEAAEEAARAKAADDQWRASLKASAGQCKVWFDAMIEAGFTEEAAATVTGHWIAASIIGGQTGRMIEPLTQMVQRFMEITGEEES